MFKSYNFTFAVVLAILIPVKGIILQDCSRYVAITKLFLPSQQVNGFTEKDSIQIKASSWRTCFLSCCNLPSCREVVYSEWLGCLHIKCSGAFGFCKYRPNELKDSSVHGIIIGVRNTEVLNFLRHTSDIPVSGQLDQFQFRNGPSLVTSAMRFVHVQQCAQYVEQENVTGVAKSWATKRFSPFSYLYQKPHRVPPLGMRSAVPLGGLGTGSFELRADGTFAEWTLENQSPGGSAKLGQGALDLAVIGVRVQTSKGVRTSLLRTHPPQGLPGVNGLSYSGGFPVSKLVVEDKGFFGVRMELFAYATLHARNATASALPAVFFTLRVYNPTSLRANVSLLLNLPLGEQPDTSREGFDFKVVNNAKLPSTCARLCQDQTKCKAWSLENGTCKLKDRMPLHAYKKGTTSGVKGFWGSSHESLTCGRPGRYPNSGSTTIMWVKNDKNNDNDNDDGDNSFEDSYDNKNRNHSYDSKKNYDKNRSRKIQYDVIKLPVDGNDNHKTNYNNCNTNTYDDNDNNKRENKKTKLKNKCKKEKIRKKTTKKEKIKNDKEMLFSSAVSNDIKEIWSYFRKDGHLRNMVVKDTGFHGSGVSMMSLGPGEEGAITLVMAWHYPFRDHAGETVGQYYGNIFKSSEEVALHAKQNIHDVLNELLIWRQNMMPPKTPAHKYTDPHEVFHVESSLPDWLQDILVNSLSYWRTGFWVADGRWRQWETFDCNDVDSVHNDFQRELPYILFFPGLLENVVRAWANSQRPSGLIMEALQGQFGCWGKTNKLDSVGGRYNMADVNPAFIAQVYHLYVWAGKENLLQDLWPAVRKATQWMIDEGTDGTGLPLRMANTYDILQLQQYDHAFYNCVVFLLGLRAVEEMAEIQKDVDMYLLVRETIAKALEKIDQLFWDEERGYYHAWWDRKKGSPPWLMADSLYGQVWAYTLGLGNLLDPEKMKSHLYNEGLLNDTPYGLQVMTTNNKGRKDDSQKTRQKRDATEEWKRYFELNQQYYENLSQNRHSLSFNEVNYDANENHAKDLQPFSEGYENTLNIYQNQPYLYSLGQYGYEMNQKKGFRGKNSDWDKYFNTIYREKLPNINGYLTTNSLKGEKELTRLQYQNWQSTSSVALDRSWYDWPARSEKTEESINAFTSRKVYESASLGHETKADTSEDHLEAKAIFPPKSILNNCSLLQKQALHKSIWMGASPDWTALQIHLGMDPYKALKQAKKSLLHYRDHLKDFWNIHGLTAGSDYGLDGQPWCTSHYTFHMVLWHIPFALSGQQYSIIERSLVFNPRVKVPYSLPFFLPYASGNIEAIPYGGGVSFKISVTHGYLVLKTLSVSGNVWPGKVLKLEKGEYLIWS